MVSRRTMRRVYHTRQGFSRTIGAPGLQAKAAANSGMLATTPFTRQRGGEWGSVMAWNRRSSGRWLAQSHWASPTKNR